MPAISCPPARAAGRLPATGSVRGRVTVEGTGEPIEGALVSTGTGGPHSHQPQRTTTRTDADGRYEIVYKWDYECLSDVQVTANVKDKPIAQSPIHFSVANSIRIYLIQANESYIGPTEYESTEQIVLTCNDDFDINNIGPDQFDYLLGKTLLAEDVLTDYLLARKLASASDVPSQVFYGLFRAKLPNSLQGLLAQPPKVLDEAIQTSINHNIIDRKFSKAVKPMLASLQEQKESLPERVSPPAPKTRIGRLFRKIRTFIL